MGTSRHSHGHSRTVSRILADKLGRKQIFARRRPRRPPSLVSIPNPPARRGYSLAAAGCIELFPCRGRSLRPPVGNASRSSNGYERHTVIPLTVIQLLISVQRLTTEASALPKKKNIVRKIVLTTGAATATFYIGSTFVAFNNQDYYDLFTEHVPLGQSMIVFAEGRGWDNITAQDVIKGTSSAAMTSYRFVNDLINGQLSASQAIDKGASKIEKGASAVEQKASEVKTAAIKIVKQTKDKVGPSVEEAKKAVKEATEKVVEKVEGAPKAVVEKVEAQYDDLVQRAEAAIAGRPYEPKPAVVEEVPVASGSVYSAPLPLGFEPPPGYSRPAPPKPAVGEGAKAPEPAPVVLPSLVEAVTTDSEPIITHLAGTIDNLAAFLKADPKAAAQAGDVLETAKGDLAALVDRIEAAKQHERSALEAKLDEQTHEYSLKLLELEMEAQDKLDSQETGYKQLFEHERGKLIQAYREKLNHELQVQTELINER